MPDNPGAGKGATFSPRETHSSDSQVSFQQRLQHAFLNSPLPNEDLLRNLGLYIRSSLLAKYLFLNDVYLRILEIPGAIVEFGTWWGHNLVLFENLRAIHEPFNKDRHIFGFDTFQGYSGFTDNDGKGGVITHGGYSTGIEYKRYLEELLEIHEGCNILGHIRGNHSLQEGDIRETAPKFFKEHPEIIVALAYFDLGLYEPTKVALESLKPSLVPGSVIVLDELTSSESPGEAIAFREALGGASSYRIEKSKITPTRAIVTIKEIGR